MKKFKVPVVFSVKAKTLEEAENVVESELIGEPVCIVGPSPLTKWAFAEIRPRKENKNANVQPV